MTMVMTLPSCKGVLKFETQISPLLNYFKTISSFVFDVFFFNVATFNLFVVQISFFLCIDLCTTDEK